MFLIENMDNMTKMFQDLKDSSGRISGRVIIELG